MKTERTLTAPQQDFLKLIAESTLPLMVAPMFLVSGPDLVVACAQTGIVGSFPAANARTVDALKAWMEQTRAQIERLQPGAAWCLNMIVHSSYTRFSQELELVAEYEPKIVSTALGSPRRVLDTVHGYGGIVMADVVTPSMARKAADAGVDVLVLVTQGAGGHTGHYHPFALLAEVRKFWSGPLGLAGAISSGIDIRAAQVVGADFVVAGTRFIATSESLADPAYRALLVQSGLEDLVASKAVSGVLANWLKPSLEAAGWSSDQLHEDKKVDFAGDISAAPKAWKTVWSAGHGVGAVNRIADTADVVADLKTQYLVCIERERVELQQLVAGDRHAVSANSIAIPTP